MQPFDAMARPPWRRRGKAKAGPAALPYRVNSRSNAYARARIRATVLAAVTTMNPTLWPFLIPASTCPPATPTPGQPA